MISLLVACALANEISKPNLIYIMADDLGYGELGCFGQKKIPTPNLDRLAAEGVKMTRAYSGSPVCAPTRYSLMTGKHQGHAAIRGNKEQGGFGPNDKEGQTPVKASETLLQEVLQKGGYRTGLVGKWALGGTDLGQNPLDHGFDFFYGYLCQRRAHNFYPPYLWKNREVDLLDNPVYSAHQKINAPLPTEAEYQTRYGGKTYSATRLMEEC
ncbi:MAG: sulfatase-like hydrolase/transferase, partial [Armatimonadetes bacterium]|nr:sulfatase-like hydrolase/transferase [Armatimonadota bacterium]